MPSRIMRDETIISSGSEDQLRERIISIERRLDYEERPRKRGYDYGASCARRDRLQARYHALCAARRRIFPTAAEKEFDRVNAMKEGVLELFTEGPRIFFRNARGQTALLDEHETAEIALEEVEFLVTRRPRKFKRKEGVAAVKSELHQTGVDSCTKR